jgi:hypothetical protein
MMNILVTSPHALPTLVLHSEDQFTSSFHCYLRICLDLRALLSNTMSKFVVSTVNTPNLLTEPSISQTDTVLVRERDHWYKRCTSVLRLWLKLRKS